MQTCIYYATITLNVLPYARYYLLLPSFTLLNTHNIPHSLSLQPILRPHHLSKHILSTQKMDWNIIDCTNDVSRPN